jgi:hypothetical protein
MACTDGGYPQFNDCVRGANPSPAAIEKYARALGLPSIAPPSDAFVDLQGTGYARYRRERYAALVDAGPFSPRIQPGHGHCDMLSFEMSVDKDLVIANSGTSTYERSTVRQSERSTAAHNTVQLNGAEQTEIWSAFRAGRRARIVERETSGEMLRAAHDGFRGMHALHRRTYRFPGNGLEISDEIVGKGAHLPAVARLHFVPGIDPIIMGDEVKAGPLIIAIEGSVDQRIADFDYAVDFNLRLPSKMLEMKFFGELRTAIAVR